MPPDVSSLSVPALVAAFSVAAVLVWGAGTKLAGTVKLIAERTGLGKAFTGMLLLGGITSLPEVAAVSASAALGNAPLAINNLLGTASVNLVLLAVADVIYGRGALTAVAATPATLMQGVLSIGLGSFVAILATAGDIPILGFGAGSATILFASAGAIWISSRYERRHVWETITVDLPAGTPIRPNPEAQRTGQDQPSSRLALMTAIAAGVILVAGFLLAVSAGEIAARTGLADGMVGFILIGVATSLPEISSVTAAIRLREYDMAVGDIFGTNLFNFSLIFLADLIYAGEPLLSSSGRFEAIGAMLAVLLTGIFLVGLLERRTFTILRMGLDSLAVLIVFALGVAALSQIE